MNSNLVRGGRLLTAILMAAFAFAGLRPAIAAPKNDKNKPPAPATVVGTSYSGHASALIIQGVEEPVQGTIVLADTGMLPPAGGFLEASESDYVLYGTDGVTVALGVEFAAATTAGLGSQATADSSLTGFQVRFVSHHGEHIGEIVTITADYITASASAEVSANGQVSTTASSSFSNLRVDGVPVVVTGEPNQVFEFPDGRIVFNEKTTVTVNGQTQVKLVAMRVFMCDCMDGSFGVVEAGITPGSEPPPEEHDCGKVTGGGWIQTPSNAKGTFAVSGGIRRGEFWGHLNYNDHGAGLKVKSTRVTGFSEKPGTPGSYVITYDVEFNGLTGTAVVEVTDRGEPGRNDDFSIRLSTGYSAGGSLGGDGSGGGNIQAHKCPPGWKK